jgi:hypothetical protein
MLLHADLMVVIPSSVTVPSTKVLASQFSDSIIPTFGCAKDGRGGADRRQGRLLQDCKALCPLPSALCNLHSAVPQLE